MFNKIIVGVDGSEAADKALKMACDIGKKYDAKLYILNSPREETAALVAAGYGGYGALAALPLETHFDEVGERVVANAAKIAAEEGMHNVETSVEMGPPSEAVLKLAKSIGADLIVVGRRGLGNVASLFLGSTSLQIVKNAECACLTVNP